MTARGTMDASEFPADGPDREKLGFLLGYAIQAPSSHNTQPWLFRFENDAVSVLADRTRALPVVDPHDRALVISCGAAIGTLEVALHRFGYTGDVEVVAGGGDEPDLLARVRLDRPYDPTPYELALFDAIPKRRTNRRAYREESVPRELLDRCCKAAADYNVALHVVTDLYSRIDIGRLVAEGDRIQFADARFRRELASWVHSRRLGSRDGMSGAGFGVPDILSPVGALVIRTFDLGDNVAASDHDKIVSGSPALAVFATDRDDLSSWLATGRALARALLMLTANGVASSFLNQPIEVDSLRPGLRDTIHATGIPQLLIRIGFGPDVPASVRRPLSEVILP